MKPTLTLISIVIVSLGAVFLFRSMPGDVIETIAINQGEVGSFVIGQSKSEVLNQHLNHSFSPFPKPEKCAKNWIAVNGMSDIQRACLIESNEWEIGNMSNDLCSRDADSRVTLRFKNNILSIVEMHCTKAK